MNEADKKLVQQCFESNLVAPFDLSSARLLTDNELIFKEREAHRKAVRKIIEDNK